MKILFLSPNQIHRYNWGHQLFRNEIGRQHDVVYYGSGFPKFNSKLNANEIIKKVYGKSKPDLIMTYGWRYTKDFQGIGDVNIPKVHITVDYARPAGMPKQDKFFAKNKYDLIFAITQHAHRSMTKNNPNIKIRMLPFSVDTLIYKPIDIKKENWVLAVFNTRKDVYPDRSKIRKVLKKMGVRTVTKRIVHRRLINVINRCKITVTSNNIFSSLSMRYTEVLSCGGLLLADKPEDLEYLGLRDKKHLVIYNDMNDFRNKIKYYLDPKHEKERARIAKQGMIFVRKNHSCQVRVQQMTKILKEEFDF